MLAWAVIGQGHKKADRVRSAGHRNRNPPSRRRGVIIQSGSSRSSPLSSKVYGAWTQAGNLASPAGRGYSCGTAPDFHRSSPIARHASGRLAHLCPQAVMRLSCELMGRTDASAAMIGRHYSTGGLRRQSRRASLLFIADADRAQALLTSVCRHPAMSRSCAAGRRGRLRPYQPCGLPHAGARQVR